MGVFHYTAVEIAEGYAAKTLGDDFEGMTPAGITESGDITYVTFATTYGDGGFVHGLSCRVSVKDGKVISHSLSGENPPEDFDTGLLDGVTADHVLAYASSRAEKIFPNLEKSEIHKISIDKHNGKFAIKVVATYTIPTALSSEVIEEYGLEVTKSIRPTYGMVHYYPLEQ